MTANKPVGQVLRDPQGKRYQAFCVYDPKGKLKGWMLDADGAKQVARGFEVAVAAPMPVVLDSLPEATEEESTVFDPLPEIKEEVVTKEFVSTPKRSHRKAESEDTE